MILLSLLYDPQIYPIAVNSTSIKGGSNKGDQKNSYINLA